MKWARLQVGATAGLSLSSVEPANEGVPDGDRAEAAKLQQVAGAAVVTALLCRDCGVCCEGARFICVLVAWAAGASGDGGLKSAEAPRSNQLAMLVLASGSLWAHSRPGSACWPA